MRRRSEVGNFEYISLTCLCLIPVHFVHLVSCFNVSYPMHLMSNTADHIRTKGTGAVELGCDDVKYVTEVDCQPRLLGAFHCLH